MSGARVYLSPGCPANASLEGAIPGRRERGWRRRKRRDVLRAGGCLIAAKGRGRAPGHGGWFPTGCAGDTPQDGLSEGGGRVTPPSVSTGQSCPHGELTALPPPALRLHRLGPSGDRHGGRGHALTCGRSGRDMRRQILTLCPTVHGAVKPTGDTARPLSGDSKEVPR